ncbi:hypothetical protein PYW08_003957 [Mythimna loreyi]|uniref:Uncharacterized protein n=1 Tax=Mythimna loreyi TaxID=667449 RepID=A0ACC2QUP6_9NEOP|nr:hypothetical protein PYW08_003957 [Mythimna loreyi]
MLSACVIICVSFGFIQTAPFTNEDPFLSNYDGDYNELVRATRNLLPQAAPESVFLRPLEFKRNSYDDVSEYQDNNDFISLPTSVSDDLAVLDPLPRSSYFDHGIQAALPLEYDSIPQNVLSPILYNGQYNLQTPYEADAVTYEVDKGLAGSQEADLYPYVHTSIPAALNPVPSVRVLPPVYATHIHETMPSLENRDNFDIDVLNPENSEMMTPNLRITRSERDFLEDLRHDAMMNNLLPTMPVPFVRSVEKSPSYPVLRPGAQRTGQVMAVFPRSKINNCAIPILMRCSPNMTRGRLTGSYAEQSPQVPSGAAYRGGVEQKINTPRCPPGEVMGSNLQCITRRHIANTNESLWLHYDTP